MAHSAVQNESFCQAEWPVFESKMSHFESLKNVKKTQAIRSQLFITFSYFARTRPSAFYFGKMACISYNKCYFVSIIQHRFMLQGMLHVYFTFRLAALASSSSVAYDN